MKVSKVKDGHLVNDPGAKMLKLRHSKSTGLFDTSGKKGISGPRIPYASMAKLKPLQDSL